jgi:chromosomal replication initiator protein
VISSDRHPNDIPTLSDRLQSRFGWGMSIDMYAHDFETRCAIVSQKSESMGHNLDSELVAFIANFVKNNVRELEGIINQLVAFCEIRSIGPNVQVAKTLFGKQQARSKHASPKKIIELVSQKYGVSVADITSPKRDKDIVFPRQIAMFLLREDLGISFPKVATLLGRKDHTTAIHSVEKIARELSLDPSLKSEISELRERF